MNPQKYIISTSYDLSPKNKDKIIDVCTPYIKSASDIYGQDDLNNLISKYPEIENNHFKLWLSSTNILNRILHGGLVNESIWKLNQIKEDSVRFVLNPSYYRALELV